TGPIHQGDPHAIPGWAKAAALLTAAGSLSGAALIWVLGTQAAALAALAPLLWALGALALGLAVLLGILRIKAATNRSGENSSPTPAAGTGATAVAVAETTATVTRRGIHLGTSTLSVHNATTTHTRA
ncbi:hypothetical protein, partial [Streptomyces alkaliphilus]|uniref:hypothetical protein n=1 Tax=Streptomyces alkaliphilus TaxID=1472722 RepID=UPI00389AFDE6